MTDSNLTDAESDAIIEAGLSAVERLREQLAAVEEAKAAQPTRLAKARSDADEARGWSLIEEPWETLITALPAHDSGGKRTGDALALPSITAKELFGARLAFDMLDCGDDHDRLEEVKTRYFSMAGGDTGILFLLFASALDTVASLVVTQMVDEIEERARNYDTRVMLAEARVKAWSGRVAELRGPHDQAGAEGGDV